MGTNIIIKHPLQSNAVIRAGRDQYKIKLQREDLQFLYDMLHICVLLANQSENCDLDILVIEEFRSSLETKFYNCEHKASMKLKPSQTHVLFFWLNSTEFTTATYDMLARRLVDQLYQQIV